MCFNIRWIIQPAACSYPDVCIFPERGSAALRCERDLWFPLAAAWLPVAGRVLSVFLSRASLSELVTVLWWSLVAYSLIFNCEYPGFGSPLNYKGPTANASGKAGFSGKRMTKKAKNSRFELLFWVSSGCGSRWLLVAFVRKCENGGFEK